MGKQEKDLEYYKRLRYNTIVRKSKGKFLLYIPELSLLEDNESIDKAYKKLDAEKEKYFKKMIEMEAKDEIVEPALIGRGRKRFETGLIPFFLKLLSVAAVVVVLLATIDDLSSTFKYIKRASKKFSKSESMRQSSKGSLQNLNIDQIVFQALSAKARYDATKIEKEMLSKEYELITPVGVYESDHFGPHNVELAFDSTDGTFWHAMGSKASITVECDSPGKLQAFRITSRHDIPGMQSPDKTIIEGSDDNNNWERIEEVPQISCGKGESRTIFIQNNKDYKYYKFNFSKWLDNSHVSVAEMTLYKKKL